MASEFDLIERHFTRPTRRALLGVGDDCALLAPALGREMAISTDMLVAGVHFFADTDPRRLGHKTLAVNLSDLAAMGATPRYATLALALPVVDDAWLARFARGLFALADAHEVELIGGDTTRGPLTLCMTVIGEVPAGAAIRRDGARTGDEIWVSGTLGDAALGLAMLKGLATAAGALGEACIARLEAPMPRLALGVALRGLASAMLDVSDGLIGDLAHVARASGVSARIDIERLPLAPALRLQPRADAVKYALAGGDDYELCFTASPRHHEAVLLAGRDSGVAVTVIGDVLAAAGAPVLLAGSESQAFSALSGYDHFGTAA